MGYHKCIFTTNTSELLVGLLSQYEFEAFEETSEGVEAWLPESEAVDEIMQEVRDQYAGHFTRVTVEYVADTNWNALWESRFDPVEIDDFCRIRALFHPHIPGFTHEVVIEPKLAFGTGHHETTFMMIQAMAGHRFDGKRVLDLGCGTGVLAIMAAKLGATEIVAVDIESESVENAIENAQHNHVEFEVLRGSVDLVKDRMFDMILANINRNAIMFLMKDIVDILASDGVVYFSGFLDINEREVVEQASGLGLKPVQAFRKGEWMCIGFGR